jgi:hypothetical protein
MFHLLGNYYSSCDGRIFYVLFSGEQKGVEKMKKQFSFWIFSLVVMTGSLFSSCGISKSEMENGIRESFQEKMDTDSNYKKYGMKAQKVILIKSGSNSYDGFVTVLLYNETHDVSISVTTDGSSYMWETKPLAFGFLMQYELDNLDIGW